MKRAVVLSALWIFCSVTILNAQDKNIYIDFNTELGRLKDLGGVNTGPGNSLQGYKDAGIYLIRTHDSYGPTDYDFYTTFYNKTTLSFDSDFDPTNPVHYKWVSSNTDAVISAIEENGFETYFRIGVSWPSEQRKSPTAPPLDPDGINFTKFAELVKRTVMHYNEGWDNGFEYDITYWEIWNEPDATNFWTGTAQQFYKLYEASVRAIKSLSSDLKVGGPGITGQSTQNETKRAYRDNFLIYCRDNDVPLDFYSWHIYRREDPYDLKR